MTCQYERDIPCGAACWAIMSGAPSCTLLLQRLVEVDGEPDVVAAY